MASLKAATQLGMPVGTAMNKLKKELMFLLAQKCGMDICHRCGGLIASSKELSVEHIQPWLDSATPSELFFSLDNIAFSHLSCNVAAARKRRVSLDEKRKQNAAGMRKHYSTEKRRLKYQRTGW